MDRGRCQPSLETTPSLKSEDRMSPHLAIPHGSFKRIVRIFSIKGNEWIEWAGGSESSVGRVEEGICAARAGRGRDGEIEEMRDPEHPTKKPQPLSRLRLARATSGTRTLDFSF